MPKRTRQHKLETESRLQFESLLPLGWVHRSITPDYGIDMSVELFDKEGCATSQQFLVQLKGTDISDIERARRVTLKTEWVTYYLSSLVPVLIARYHAPTQTMFTSWIYDLVPLRPANAHKTTAVVMPENSRWTDNTASQITKELSAIQKMRSPGNAGPFALTLLYANDRLFESPIKSITLALRDASSAIPQVLRFTEHDDSNVDGYVHIQPTSIRVRVAGQGALTVDLPPAYGLVARSHLISDILVLVGIKLDELGYSVQAGKLICFFAAESSLVRSKTWIERLARPVERAGNLSQGVELVERLFLSDGCIDAAYALFTRLFSASGKWSQSDHAVWDCFLFRLLDIAERSREPNRIALASYNVGNNLRTRGAFRIALKHYRNAYNNDPEYSNRGYFLREVAGCLFSLKRYAISTQYYAQAVQLGEDSLCIGLYADALMFAGRYEEAAAQFEVYVKATAPRADASFQLKLWGLYGIQQIVGVSSQKRQYREAQELACSLFSMGPRSMSTIREVLKLDALHGTAWFNLGLAAMDEKKSNEVLSYFVIAAVVQPHNLQAWVYAFLIAGTQHLSLGLTILIARAAYFYNREQFVRQVLAQADANPDKEFGKIINRLVTVLLDDLQAESVSPTVRIRSETR